MCGRYVIKAPVSQLATMFDLMDVPPLTPRYNVAPTQMVPAVRLEPETKKRELVMYVGDRDPSGLDIPRSVEANLR